MSAQQNGSARQAVAQLVAELARARRAIEAGAMDEARAALAAVRALDPGNLQAIALEERCSGPRAGARASSDRPARPPRTPPPITEQPGWLAFERTIRERRARRCVETADAAINAGLPSEAQEAIDELAMLVPAHPHLPELRERAGGLRPMPLPDAGGAPDVQAAGLAGIESVVVTDLPAGEVPLVLSAPPPAIERPAPSVEAIVRPRRGGWVRALAIASAIALGSAWWFGRDEQLPGAQLVMNVASRATESSRAHPPSEAVSNSRVGAGPSARPLATRSVPGGRAEVAAPTEEFLTLSSGSHEDPLSGESLPSRIADAAAGGAASSANADAAAPPDDAGRAPAPDVDEASDPASPSPAAQQSRSALAPQSQPARASTENDSPEAADGSERPRVTLTETNPAPLAEVAASVGTGGATPESARARSFAPTGAVRPVDDAMTVPRDGAASGSHRPGARPEAANAAAARSPAAARTAAPPPIAGVKNVLDRYAFGYSTRQAGIVQQVWPKVDQRALERAFSQLESQQVSFTACDIDAEEAKASATCSGTASWVPVVGDRSPRRQSRTWHFVLTKEARGWIITEARVER